MAERTKAQRFKDVIDQIERFRFCGPSDDPDEQTAVLYAFRHLVTAFRRAGRSLADHDLRRETQEIDEPESLYDAYDVHSRIAAMLDDIKENLDSGNPLESPTSDTNLRAFISYSTSDKLTAKQVKTVLDEHEIESFLAHEDISVSQEWRDRIIHELQRCNIFVPLLSAEFYKSEWAPPEIGLAFSRKHVVLFIPLSIDGTVPRGFISHIQGKRLSDSRDFRDPLIEPMLERFPHQIIPRLIKRLAGANSFRGAESLMSPLVPHFATFNSDEIDAFATTSIKNCQIWDAGLCATEFLPEFLRMHREKVAPDKLAALEYQVNNREWYPVIKRRRKG